MRSHCFDTGRARIGFREGVEHFSVFFKPNWVRGIHRRIADAEPAEAAPQVRYVQSRHR
ncbi:MAG: hypothetical protein JWP03_5492, partial [Phycisphaerales bacterium]|nr:hypothetical protein [Phycisphaerales bacterium]